MPRVKKPAVGTLLDEQIESIVEATAERAALTAAIDTMKDDLKESMEKLDILTHHTVTGHGATIVKPMKVTIHDDQLKKKIGATLWGKITSRKIDSKLLDDAIARNVIDAVLVSACSDEEPLKEYVKVTPSKVTGGSP